MASQVTGFTVSCSREWGGVGYIAGSGAGDPAGLASRNGAPASVPLVLYLKDTLRPVAFQWSLANGHYQFNNLNPSLKFFLIGFDHLGTYQMGAVDQITPKV